MTVRVGMRQRLEVPLAELAELERLASHESCRGYRNNLDDPPLLDIQLIHNQGAQHEHSR